MDTVFQFTFILRDHPFEGGGCSVLRSDLLLDFFPWPMSFLTEALRYWKPISFKMPILYSNCIFFSSVFDLSNCCFLASPGYVQKYLNAFYLFSWLITLTRTSSTILNRNAYNGYPDLFSI